ncbi:hypothetical protein KSP40_PGU002151 [Platanthera guangdongensis]|uniref:Transposase (putative) gypsy type domain-containing protein n=1 Tax=Platanthera guangdongensis TaxID=2320717 RepID=A0ABR2MRC0_9ASPA
MGKTNPDADGRSKCAQYFTDYCFFDGHTSKEELAEFKAEYVPPGFEARRPGEGEAINTFYEDELAFPISHFEVGLRLPLWPEIRQILKYYGAVPAQLNSNAVAMMVAFASYLQRERIEFNLTVFRKLFSYKATPDVVAYFGGSLIKVREIANKASHLDDQDRLHQGRSRQHPLLAPAEGRGGIPPAGRVRQRCRAPQLLPPQRLRGRLPAEGPRRAPPRSSWRRYRSLLFLPSSPDGRARHIAAEFTLNFSKYFPAGERIIPANRRLRIRGRTWIPLLVIRR